MIERDPKLVARHASALHGAGGVLVGQVHEPMEAPRVPEPEREAKVRRPGSRIALTVALLVMAGFAAVVIIGFLKFLNGPVQATAKAGSAAVTPSGTPKPTTNQLAGLYFDMIYPAIFDQVGSAKNGTHSLEQYNISSKKDYRRVMAVNVQPLASGLLEDDASYKWRHINPKDYREKAEKAHGEPVAVMSKADNTEVTLFWAHKGMLLTVAMTSTNPDDVVANFMTAVLPTLRWRE